MGSYFSACLFLSAGLVFAGSDASKLPNFHQVDERVYRGAQPAAKDFAILAQMGIKTVLDLRDGDGHVRSEEKLAKAAGLRYISLPMHGFEAPSEQQITRALAILQDAGNGPVFVHCRRGADRTGTVIACYRIAHDQWPNQKALDEARGFGMSSLEFAMRGYVLRYHGNGTPASPVPTIAAESAAH